MSKIRNNNQGFAVVELLLVIFTLAVIGVASYFVAKHINNKSKPAVSSSTTTQSNANLKTYCDAAAALCLKYPSNWNAQANDSAVSVAEVIINPISSANIGYLNIATSSEPTTSEIDTSNPLDPNTLTSSNMVNTSSPVNFYTVSVDALSGNQYSVVGGYVMGANENVPCFFVIDTSKVNSMSLKTGTTTSVQFPLALSSSAQQGHTIQIGGGPIASSSYTANQAAAWFNAADAKAILNILQTLYVN